MLPHPVNFSLKVLFKIPWAYCVLYNNLGVKQSIDNNPFCRKTGQHARDNALRNTSMYNSVVMVVEFHNEAGEFQ